MRSWKTRVAFALSTAFCQLRSVCAARPAGAVKEGQCTSSGALGWNNSLKLHSQFLRGLMLGVGTKLLRCLVEGNLLKTGQLHLSVSVWSIGFGASARRAIACRLCTAVGSDSFFVRAHIPFLCPRSPIISTSSAKCTFFIMGPGRSRRQACDGEVWWRCLLARWVRW